jgi:2-polyprenyl-3-methyl-5-hydroxy-6-metoxy-1,4-benzoquinol methylase
VDVLANTELIEVERKQVAWGNYETNLQFLEMVGLGPAPLRILEIGCGKGAILSHLHSAGHRCNGIDIDRDSVHECRAAHPQLSVECGSGDAIPFPPASFDVVLSFDVLEHIRDSDRHIAEVKRVLAPGGRYLLQTPNKWTNIPFEILRHAKKMHLGPVAAYRSAMEDHCALHNYWQLRRRLERHGFETTFFDVPVVNDYFKQKMRNYVGPLGPALLAVLNPDKLPIYLRTNFYARAVLRQ